MMKKKIYQEEMMEQNQLQKKSLLKDWIDVVNSCLIVTIIEAV